MIVVDANILLYAEDRLSPFHQAAKTWWDAQLSGDEAVGLTWLVLTAFIRIATNHRVFTHPLALSTSLHRIQSWLDQPCTHLIGPTKTHWAVLEKLLQEGKATAHLVSDAHLAAIAVEHDAVLYSTDADFARFAAVKWKKPF